MIHQVRVNQEHEYESSAFGPVSLVKYVAQSLKARRSAKQRHFIEHEGVSVEVDEEYVSAPIEDGDLELARYYRDGQVIILIYHWNM